MFNSYFLCYPVDLLHLLKNPFARKRISANPSPNSNSIANPNPEAQ